MSGQVVYGFKKKPRGRNIKERELRLKKKRIEIINVTYWRYVHGESKGVKRPIDTRANSFHSE